ncbi:glycine zipper 2TM domain-containing protein [Pseudoduganella umbonata]|uniref:Glycine zipper 2TM domain-containing protein n=1 Tax=Pseudoduganella umbonata TaxID=864828 RepID=A0A4P8HXB6_9BURK|nr:glycine zipper 2TM domain-containing protein [Pseudoduganella umbonata]MBB3224066.1 outer membrane lipoprotein SlyB [Pseudoduganella umbonata]QCP14066.1 glycine zipper 2TM domain-containing protein [Pseudoduganella umbonata]
MNQPNNHPSTPPTKHNVPAIFIIAAVILILFCGVGIAALMGWLPSAKHAGRPGELMTPPAEQLATAPVAPATPATQSSQYAAGAGTINGTPTRDLTTSGGSAAGSTGGSAAVSAPVVPAQEERVPAPVRDKALQRERERERAADKAAESKRAASVCNECGIVESVKDGKTRGDASGVGAAGGAVVGGLLGRQVGDGRGRDLATIAGAVGGAVVGNQVEGSLKGKRNYEVVVRMHDGELRTFYTDSPVWRGGDQVKVVEGILQSR